MAYQMTAKEKDFAEFCASQTFQIPGEGEITEMADSDEEPIQTARIGDRLKEVRNANSN